MMRKPSALDRMRYAFDNTMSRGPAGLIVWLAIVSTCLVTGISFFVYFAANDPEKGLPAILLDIFYQTFTPSPVDPKAGSVIFHGGMLVATLSSLLLVSIFIGILTNVIDHRLRDLRKGRSFVIETGHTLILGWSSQVFTIISELLAADPEDKHRCIVVLADKDKVEMEDEIHSKVPNARHARIVCRTGSPLDLTDLEIVNPNAARAIIIVAPETSDADTLVIKTILALTNNPGRKDAPYHIVTEIREEKNISVAQLVGRDEVQLALAGDLISRITVQTCRQSGLSVVYTELLNFAGDEIHIREIPALVGRTFGEALHGFAESAAIGLHTRAGFTRLNPPMETRIEAGDKIIAISKESDTIEWSSSTDLGIDASLIQEERPTPRMAESTLILGWNRRGPSIIRGLDDYVSPGSKTMVVADTPGVEQVIAEQSKRLKNHFVTFRAGDTTDRQTLDMVDVSAYDHIIVLGYSDTLGVQETDARTLITLLHLRDISERESKELSIVSEMLDVRNRELAEVTRADDFIVSEQLVSLLLCQISENKDLSPVFADLFDAEGSEIYLKPVEAYIKLGTPVNFYTVVEAARQRSEVAIGFRRKAYAHDASKSYGVVVNPFKSSKVNFADGDKIIVVAEN
jgi:ion channel POLLUX/CASTOR